MQDTDLNQFVQKVMSIHADMHDASAGVVMGALSNNVNVVNNLRSAIIAFATEYVQASNHEKLLDLSQQIEGCLYTVKLFNGISEARLEELITQLHALYDNEVKN